jgi:hypothetical protein
MMMWIPRVEEGVRKKRRKRRKRDLCMRKSCTFPSSCLALLRTEEREG